MNDIQPLNSVKRLYNMRHKYFLFDGVWRDKFGYPETNGVWLIWGKEKQGKTNFALMLANCLTAVTQTLTCKQAELQRWTAGDTDGLTPKRVKNHVLYVAAEEDTAAPFVRSMLRANISQDNRLFHHCGFMPLDVLTGVIRSRKELKAVVIDNVTFYKEELNYSRMKALTEEFPDKLFIFLAHEEDTAKGEPDGALAKNIKKYAKAYFRIIGLKCSFGGRFAGGQVSIDEDKAWLYHGDEDYYGLKPPESKPAVQPKKRGRPTKK